MLSLLVVAWLFLCQPAAAASAASVPRRCDRGQRVVAFRGDPGCAPSAQECWHPGTVGDGPGRNDALRTIVWDDGFPARQRVHGSYVRPVLAGNLTPGLCFAPAAAADVSLEDPDLLRHLDACEDRSTGFTASVNSPRVFCQNISHGQCTQGSNRWLCPVSCGQCGPRPGRCWNARRMLPMLKRTARWGWYSQWWQDSFFHALFAHPDGLYVSPANRFIVEFGFRPEKGFTAMGSNSAYLKYTQGWQVLGFDLESSDPSWPYYQQQVTAANVADVFRKHGVPRELGAVSIDIDSCDLWVFLALSLEWRPYLFQVEYGRHFRFAENASMDCYGTVYQDAGKRPPLAFTVAGASMKALQWAARQRGYSVVWVERCFDVFLVRDDLLCEGSAIPSLEPFREWTLYDGGCQDPWGELERLPTARERQEWVLDLAGLSRAELRV